VTAVHFDGGIINKHGVRLPGWPCCVSGKRAREIRFAGLVTANPARVTCKRCLGLIATDERYEAKP
jgi:hypothetical protein